MAPDDRLVSIAGRLLERTRVKQQRWQATPRPKHADADWQPNEFVTRFEHGTVVVASEVPSGRYPYVLQVLDPAGNEVGRVETGQDAELWLGDREADPWEATLHDLYASARGAAVNSGAAIDGILGELEAG